LEIYKLIINTVINFNEQLSQVDAKWILEDLFPKAGYRINHDTLSQWAKGHNLAFKEQVGVSGCSCEYIAQYNVWNSRLSQYADKIRAIAYPPVITETGETGISNGKPKTSGKVGRKPKAASGLTD
jgi:hypothetical protein